MVRLTPYKQYINAGNWKCTSSPVGAHHRLAIPIEGNTFTCIYCGETKQYPRGWQPTGWRAAEIPKDIGGVRVG